MIRGFFVFLGGLVFLLFGLALQLVFWGGLIYFAFWAARHFGVI